MHFLDHCLHWPYLFSSPWRQAALIKVFLWGWVKCCRTAQLLSPALPLHVILPPSDRTYYFTFPMIGVFLCVRDADDFFQLIQLHLFKAIQLENVHKSEALTKSCPCICALFGVLLASTKCSLEIIFSYWVLKENLWILKKKTLKFRCSHSECLHLS